MERRLFDAAGNIDYDGIKEHAHDLRRAAMQTIFDDVSAVLRTALGRLGRSAPPAHATAAKARVPAARPLGCG